MSEIVVTVEQDLEGLGREIASRMSGEIHHAVKAACEEGAAEARRVHRYQDRTGKLTASIRGELTQATLGAAEGEIVASAKYASFVEEGTRPHRIEARRADALRWEGSDGAVHYARAVEHPGTKPAPFMGPAALKAERVLEARIDAAAAKVQSEIG